MYMGQKVAGQSASLDPAFPVLSGTAGKALTVYIPTINIWEMPDGTQQELLVPFRLHDWSTSTKNFGVMNCIDGLTDAGIEEQLKKGYAEQAKDENGQPMYDGEGNPIYIHKECPVCAAEKKCNQLADLKIQLAGLNKGVSPDNDPKDILKKDKETARDERVVKYAREFVVFPIVVIPTNNDGEPAVKSVSDLKAYYVKMARKRYNEKVCAGLNSGLKKANKPKFLGGNFMTWDFCSNQAANNQTVNPRDAARDATYTIIKDADDLEVLNPLREMCEEAAKDFTQEKATEVVRDVIGVPYNEMVAKLKGMMKETEDSIIVFQNKLNGTTPNAIPALESPEQLLANWSANNNGTPATPATPTMPTTSATSATPNVSAPATSNASIPATPEQLIANWTAQVSAPTTSPSSATTADVQDATFGGQRFTMPNF